jgi:hypothetical protein
MITFAARFPNLNAASIEGFGLQVMSITQDKQMSNIVRVTWLVLWNYTNLFTRENSGCLLEQKC